MSVFHLLALHHSAEPYTGRGMSKSCLGFMCSSQLGFIADCLATISENPNVKENVEEFSDALRNAEVDSMGMRKIFYFKGISPDFLNEEDEEDEEDYE